MVRGVWRRVESGGSLKGGCVVGNKSSMGLTLLGHVHEGRSLIDR